MATASRRQTANLRERLAREPWRFEFFQAVRLLERIAHERGASGAHGDAVRFRAAPARSFPGTEVVGIEGLEAAAQPDPRSGGEPRAPEMSVAFMGLTGPSGVLPEWYLDLLLTQIRQRDFGMRDFLDLFNHRAVSLFYRAWRKYRFELNYERSRLEGGDGDDLFSRCLISLVGLGTAHLTGRLGVPDAALAYYGGHFSRSVRPAVALEAMLTDFLSAPTKVSQFHGRWLDLVAEDQTRLSAHPRSEGLNACLGQEAIIGRRLWDVESGVRIDIGPLDYDEFVHLLPGTAGFGRLSSFVRAYVGPGLDVDVQLMLAPTQVPLCQLRSAGGEGSRLGWNSWLYGTNPHQRASEVVFTLEDWDTAAQANDESTRT